MQLTLIDGQFNPEETKSLLAELIQVKIKFQENKIQAHASEEDIKMREKKIKKLQYELFKVRNFTETENITIHCEINFSK